jgi:hypothetical protein
MTTTIRAHIYTRGEVSFAKFLFLLSWFDKLLEVNFFVLPKLDGCQVDLTNCWSCLALGDNKFRSTFYLYRSISKVGECLPCLG